MCLTKKNKSKARPNTEEWQSAKRRRRKRKGGEGIIFFLAPRTSVHGPIGKSLLRLVTAYPPDYTVIGDYISVELRVVLLAFGSLIYFVTLSFHFESYRHGRIAPHVCPPQ
jgi:hypothetical protein